MTAFRRRRSSPRESASGFALVTCMLMIMLLLVLAFGLLSLSTIELRRSTHDQHAAAARANARMALISAIGQLQETMGPDQRVSATADILGDGVKQPHWTGVWPTRQADGSSWFTRDDLDGGLHDGRAGKDAKENALAWLTSGRGDPRVNPTGDTVTLMSIAAGAGDQSLADKSQDAGFLKVPAVKVMEGSKVTGHYGWWTGDLGVRANIATTDPRADIAANRETAGDGGIYRMMASAAADLAMMEGAKPMGQTERERLASAGTSALTSAGPVWSKQHGFDFTVASRGVLADVSEGGLKRDLTAYLAGTGTEPELNGRAGLTDDDVLAGGLSGSAGGVSPRHLKTAPRFGVLRDWAKETTTFAKGHAEARSPETGTADVAFSREEALANEKPVKLAGNKHVDLQPVLVEATSYIQISSYPLDVPEGNRPQYQLRHLLYPRVVLWNPYNVDLQTGRSMVMIQGNGRQEMWTQNTLTVGPVVFTSTSQWLSFEGGRSTDFQSPGSYFDKKGYNDKYMGSYYFSIPATKFGPGECLVFSPAKSAEYNCITPYNSNINYNLDANELSCEVAPDPSRSYYVSASDIGGGVPYLPTEFWYAPTPYWSQGGRNGVENQSDDTRAILKEVGPGNSSIQFDTFDALPQLSVLSASLQFGAGREPRIAWNEYERMPIELLERVNPKPTLTPNVRTREGIRLRWFTEHKSNKIGSGALAGTPHFEDALLANWNPRATYIIRSPWDNIGGSLPASGSGGGPWFFGAYTRDLFDQDVKWDEQVPVPRGGRYHGNPFGPPQEGADRYVLFDLPRTETGVVSLAQFQHAKVSELVWHPSFAIANSLADPRLGTGANGGLNRTAALAFDKPSAAFGGFHEEDLGWSSDTQRAKDRGAWAEMAREILGKVPETDNLVYDLSFEANQTLWDRFFLSSGTKEQKVRFRNDPQVNPLPNSRMQLATGATASVDSLTNFHRAAAQLMVDGAFNVNSTRVEAWKALLGSSKLTGYGTGGTPFPRVLNPPGAAWKTGDPAWNDNAWAGYRELNDDEVQRLAEAIVEQVKLRGPFISMADFVNRRLAENETGRMGALQAAIEKAGLNASHVQSYPLDNHNSLPDYNHPDNLRDATRLEQTLKPASKAWGAPSYLTQGDVLQVIGPALSARSDSFVIRTYGDSVDLEGKVQARAWCEATVQRTPEPLVADASGLDSRDAGRPGDFGRRFVMVSFRWLSPEEI